MRCVRVAVAGSMTSVTSSGFASTKRVTISNGCRVAAEATLTCTNSYAKKLKAPPGRTMWGARSLKRLKLI